MATQRVVWSFVAKDKFSRIANNIRRKTEAMNAKFKHLNRTLKKTHTGLKKLAGKLKMASAAAGVAALGFAKSFGNIEQGLTSIYGLLDEADFKKYGKLIDTTITESMTNFGVNTEDSTRALYNAISVLGASESTFKSYNAAVELAIGGNADLAAATLGVGKLMNAYEEFGMTGGKAADIGKSDRIHS